MTQYKGKRSKKDLIESLPADALRDTARFWANNSLRYECEDGSIGWSLHDTEICRRAPDGTITLNTDGWQTSTTKQRLNELLPSGLYIYQESGIWYLQVGGWQNGQTYVFQDGMQIGPEYRGQYKVTGAGPDPKAARAQRKAIKKYAKDYIEALFAGEVGLPSGGDCWFCCLVNEDGESMGDFTGDTDHLTSHIEERYYVPSLLLRAIESNPNRVSQVALWTLQDLWGGGGEQDLKAWPNRIAKEQLRKALEGYLLEQFGLPR